jgi:hypothetical protein
VISTVCVVEDGGTQELIFSARIMRRNEAGRKDDLTPELDNQRATIIKDIHYRIITRRNLDRKVAPASVGCEINNTIRMIITIIYLSVSCKINYRTEF